jgi:tRNA modification GTPase
MAPEPGAPGPSASDTIAAIATPPGRGGVGIVRVSGPQVPPIAEAILGALPPPRTAVFRAFRDADGSTLDQGIALYFPAPRSFTGEPVLELHGHGGPVVMDLLLERTLASGARLARPGEFSERAFLNDKLDLAQAEAVADLIDSASAAAARSAVRSLEGRFSREVHACRDALVDLRVYVEGAIDFPDEDVDFLATPAVAGRLGALRRDLEGLLERAFQGTLLRDGMTLVLAGRPNVGKSSLLNALAGSDRAIVTDVPGTTRDLIRERLVLDGLPVNVIDTAGLRHTADPVEAEGIARARGAIATADAVLLVTDAPGAVVEADRQLLADLPPGPERVLVCNKIDLHGADPGLHCRQGLEEVHVSARTGAGIPLLRDHLKGLMGFRPGEGEFSARRRHLEALREAEGWLAHGAGLLAAGTEPALLAEDLRLAQEALGRVTGEYTSDDLLGEIFSRFCIGK